MSGYPSKPISESNTSAKRRKIGIELKI